MSILSNIQQYGAAYELISQSKLSKEDIKAIHKIAIVDSQFGPSMCFFTVNGTKQFIPLDKNSNLQINQSVNPEDVIIKELGGVGKQTIYRADILE